ncbi:MAG: hypothetical protein ACOC6R_03695 [Chloroflexota bacterium]
MNNTKIAVQIKLVKDPNGNKSLKATAPMSSVFRKDFDARWLNEELQRCEDKYLRLVDNLKSILNLIKARERKGKVLLYWMFGDEIHEFTERNKDGTLFVENLTAHLIRDIGASEKMIHRCKKFRSRYPDINNVNLGRSFNNYVETFEGGYISARRKRERKVEKSKDA